MNTTCVCGHEQDEHVDGWECWAEIDGNDCGCLLYEPDEDIDD